MALRTAADIHNDERLGLYRATRFYSATLSGNVTLDATYPEICKFDANGSNRNVTLDSESLTHGLFRKIVNSSSGATNLVVKDADANTIGTVNQNEEGDFYNDAGTWTLVAIRTIALS
jgi:hypothetical protein